MVLLIFELVGMFCVDIDIINDISFFYYLLGDY